MSKPVHHLTTPSSTRRRWATTAALVAAVLAALAVGEWFGWPMLARPLQAQVSKALERRVQFSGDVRLRFIGGVHLQAAAFEVAAPAWSTAPHLLKASELDLALRWTDLWRAWQGQRLRIERLHAATLDVHLERRADGAASWDFVPTAAGAPREPRPLPLFGSLAAGSGVLHVNDVPRAVTLEAKFLREGGLPARAARGLPAAAENGPPSANPAQAAAATRWLLEGRGRLRQLPLRLTVHAEGRLGAADPLTLGVEAHVGRAWLDYRGTLFDSADGLALRGRFALKGPSLAAVGDVAGVTLPTTAAFHSRGAVVKRGAAWHVVLDELGIGASRLDGAFTYDSGRRVPMLAGRLGGSRLLLTDLGPVVGATPVSEAPTARTAAAPAPAPTQAVAPAPAAPRKPGRVLPSRPFDLASLRVMDANVLLDIASMDLNSSLLQPLQPLRGHLQLSGGVLTLSELDARTALGHLTGLLSLDGRGDTALWRAELRWGGLRLERWVQQKRAGGAPPFVSGRLDGRASLSGRGRSTAEILASLGGSARTELHGGAVSHLALEAAGLDLAQGLGVLVRGDRALPVSCAVADLVAERGVFSTRVMVVDTTDSTVWIDGTLSLASETLDLRAVVSPKDLSPLALRTPLQVRGTLANPQVTLDKAALGPKLAASFLLGLLNPLAALIPLFDVGDEAEAARSAAACRRLMTSAASRVGR